VNNHEGKKPPADWIRPPGRPRRTWLKLVQKDANAIPLLTLWRAEIARDWQGSWSGAMVCQNFATTMMMIDE